MIWYWNVGEVNIFKGFCGKFEDIFNVKYLGMSFNFNDRLKYSCEKGYMFVGFLRRRCKVGGKWFKVFKCLGKLNLVIFFEVIVFKVWEDLIWV